MKEIASNIYQFPPQRFFGELVYAYAIEESEVVFCFDIPESTPKNLNFLRGREKPIRMIMSHGSTANGFEETREILRNAKVDVQIWLHDGDRHNRWLSIAPDVLLSGDDKKLSERLTLISTPGHTSGSVCLHAAVGNGIIFSGDTLGGTRAGDIRPFELKDNELSLDVFFSSLRKLLTYEFEYIFPFHYLPITDAKSKLLQYLKRYDKKR